MNNNNVAKVKILIAVMSALTLIVYGFFANEARKEIYYLCGNIKADVSYSSVIKQLDTANLSTYTIENVSSGKHVVLSNLVHLYLLRCDIKVNSQDVVNSASYEMRLGVKGQ